MQGPLERTSLFALVASAAFGVCACASAEDGDNPAARAWVAENTAGVDAGFPALRDVPLQHSANTDPAHWDAVLAEVMAAGEALKAHPRAELGVAPENPDAFLEQAQQDLQRTRDSH